MKVITFIFLFLKTANCVFIHPADDETYKILMKLCNNNFAVHVAKQANVKEPAAVKFWRSKGKFENIDNVLYYGGRRKVKKIYLIYFLYICQCIGYFATNNTCPLQNLTLRSKKT